MIRIIIATLLSTLSLTGLAQQLEITTEASPQSLCASGTSVLSAYPATAGFNSTPLPPPGDRPIVTITFAEPVTEEDFSIEKSDLKYDKHFAYSIQVDDGLSHIIDYAFPLLEGGEVDGETFPGLYYTDGCGNDIAFKMATAHYSWNDYNDNDMHDPENGYAELGDNGTITWEQIISLYENDWGIYNHGFYDNGTEGGLDYTINRNHSYTRRNTHPDIPGGIDMNLFVIPASSTELGPVAIDNGYNQILSANYELGSPLYNVNTEPYYNEEISRHFGNSTILPTVELLADSAKNGTKGMATTGTHQLNWQNFKEDMETIENQYGKSGSDSLWFATSEEVIQYLYVRDNINLNTQISGNTVTVELEGALPDDFRFYALSLLVDSDIEITQVEREDGTNPDFNPDLNGKALINLNWNERVIPAPKSLAEEFTTKAEDSEDAYDALVAMDYAMMIEDTVTQNYFLSRICSIPGVELPDDLCSSSSEFSFQWFANSEVLSEEPILEVTPSETTTYTVVMTSGSEEISDEVTVDVTDPPTVELAQGETLCPNETITLSAVSENYSAFLWESSGDGTFSSPENPETEYTPGESDITNAEVTLYATAQSEGCDDATDSVTYEFYPAPSISAPADTSICHDASLSLTVSSDNYNTISWTTNGNGTFSNSSGLSTTYTPGSEDIESGQVTLTATASEENCGAQAAANIAVQIVSSPEGNAGGPLAVCPGQENIMLQGSGSHYSNAYWQTNGAGTFTVNGIEAEYVPAEDDFTLENLTFELVLEPEAPCSDIFSETIPVSFIDPPEADAGEDSTACYGIPFQLNGDIANASGFYWSTSGNGTFTDNNSLNTYYQFGTAFQQSGQVTLRLHALPEGACESEAIDSIMLTQAPLPEIYAGDDGEMCYADTAYQLEGTVEGTDDFYWITQGDGTFSDSSAINPLYYPGPEELEAGFAYPGLKVGESATCGSTVSNDYLLLTIIQPPEATAGDDREICAGDNTELSGSAVRYDSLAWITSGDGTFDAPHQLNTTYIPGDQDVTAGAVSLTLEAHSTTGCINMDDDTVWLTITEALTVDAGEDQEICPEMPAYTCNPDVNNADSVIWSTSGTGNFSDSHALNPLYYISQADRQQGNVTLQLNAYSGSTCNEEASDELTLSLLPAPVVDAGADISICGEQVITLNGSAQYADSIFWETTGDGAFADAGAAQTTYTPGETDIMTGGAELILRASALPPCSTTRSDTAVISIDSIPAFEVTATPENIMATESSMITSSVSGNASINWDIITGNGTLSSYTGTPITYYSVLSDTIEPVQLRATANISGACSATLYDTATIYVSSSPALFAGNDTTVCETSENVTLNASYEGDDNLIWTTQGNGYFDNPTMLNTHYYFGSEDYSNGSVQLHLSPINADYPEDDLIVDINPLPSISLPDTTAGCSDEQVEITATGADFSEINWESDGNGSFINSSGLSATYQPGDEETEVLIWANAEPLEGCESNASDTTTLLLFPSPEINAGEDIQSCGQHEVPLNDASAENAEESQIMWSSTGSGSFENSSSLQTIYYPSDNDVSSGEITLTLTITSSGTCQTVVTDQLQLSFDPAPELTVSPPDTSCYGQEVSLSASASHYSSIVWESLSESTFSDSTGIYATLIPDETDIQQGEANFRVFANGTGACSTAADTVDGNVILIPEPSVNAGENQSSCGYNQVYVSGEVSGVSSGSVSWSTSGDGHFDNDNFLSTYYNPGGNDVDNGQVILTLQASSPAPCNDIFTDEVVVNIQTAPLTPDAPYGEETVCQGEAEVTLQTNPVENADSYVWYLLTGNAGTFEETITNEPENVLMLNDEFSGNYKVRVAAMNSCGTSDKSEYFSGSVKENPQVDISASPSTEVCQGEIILLDATTDEAEDYLWYPGDYFDVPVIEVDSSGHDQGHKTMFVDVTDTFGCTATDSISLFFAVCTHQPDQEHLPLSVSPNPARDQISIQYHKEADITIMNATGKVVRKTVHSFDEIPQLTMKISELQPGTYYLRLKSGSYLEVRKLIFIP
ncbi:MAG: T9SS type A sorting domain-containing protein [Bacteroidota bacterium]